MIHSFQADLFSDKKPLQYFIEEEVPNILSMNNDNLAVLYQIVPPLVRSDDAMLPTFISFSVDGEVVDSNRAIKFMNILFNEFNFRKNLCPSYLSNVGVDMNKYFVYINYVVTNLHYFNLFISGKVENKMNCKESRLLLETAYAEFIMGENITKILKKNPSFKIKYSESTIMSKTQLLDYCIQKYGFSRFMKSRMRGSIGGMNIMEMYI